MTKVEYYHLYYKPKDFGYLIFKLDGEQKERRTPLLTPVELSALALTLAQSRISYDLKTNTFCSVDN